MHESLQRFEDVAVKRGRRFADRDVP
jgi:hypothetical protein